MNFPNWEGKQKIYLFFLLIFFFEQYKKMKKLFFNRIKYI